MLIVCMAAPLLSAVEWEVGYSRSASNYRFLTAEPGSPTHTSPEAVLSYSFEVAEAGTYHLWCRALKADALGAIYWRLNGGAWEPFAPPADAGWQEALLGSLPLGEGVNQLEIANRQPGILLDVFSLTTDSASPPGITAVEEESLQAYLERHLSAAQLSDPAFSAEHADPDNDRRTNRQEYLSGTHMLMADGPALSLASISEGLQLIYQVNPATADGALALRWSGNCNQWEAPAQEDFKVTVLAETEDFLRLELTARPHVVAANDALFFRVVDTGNP